MRSFLHRAGAVNPSRCPVNASGFALDFTPKIVAMPLGPISRRAALFGRSHSATETGVCLNHSDNYSRTQRRET